MTILNHFKNPNNSIPLFHCYRKYQLLKGTETKLKGMASIEHNEIWFHEYSIPCFSVSSSVSSALGYISSSSSSSAWKRKEKTGTEVVTDLPIK